MGLCSVCVSAVSVCPCAFKLVMLYFSALAVIFKLVETLGLAAFKCRKACLSEHLSQSTNACSRLYPQLTWTCQLRSSTRYLEDLSESAPASSGAPRLTTDARTPAGRFPPCCCNDSTASAANHKFATTLCVPPCIFVTSMGPWFEWFVGRLMCGWQVGEQWERGYGAVSRMSKSRGLCCAPSESLCLGGTLVTVDSDSHQQ
jgi:hypothetical protein